MADLRELFRAPPGRLPEGDESGGSRIPDLATQGMGRSPPASAGPDLEAFSKARPSELKHLLSKKPRNIGLPKPRRNSCTSGLQYTEDSTDAPSKGPMNVSCPSCHRVLTVPPENVGTPHLKAKCRCGHVFAVTATAPTIVAPPATPAPTVSPGVGSATSPQPAVAAEAIAAKPAAQRATAEVAKSPAGGAPITRPAVRGAGTWRRCVNHPQVESQHVCPKCQRGYCSACTQKVQTAAICLKCDALCVTVASYAQVQTKKPLRARSLIEDIGVIVAYPLNDRLAYVMLAVCIWSFGLFSIFPEVYLLLTKGLLAWYSFNAVSKVAIGNMHDLMPDFRDMSDITRTLWLSLASLVISVGPLFACGCLVPSLFRVMCGYLNKTSALVVAFGAAHLVALLVPVAALWALVYTPVALTVAALSKSIASTLNPLIGIDTIGKMGSTYWQALGIYCVIVLGQSVARTALDPIPLAGGFVSAFIDSWAALAIGCALGLAVFKKAAALGWD